jgi:hypothetical protein
MLSNEAWSLLSNEAWSLLSNEAWSLLSNEAWSLLRESVGKLGSSFRFRWSQVHWGCSGRLAPPWVLCTAPPCHHSPIQIPFTSHPTGAGYQELFADDPLLNRRLIMQLKQARVHIILRRQLRLLLRWGWWKG